MKKTTVKYFDGRAVEMDVCDAVMECLRYPESIESCDDEFANILLYDGRIDPVTREVVTRRSPGPAELWADYKR